MVLCLSKKKGSMCQPVWSLEYVCNVWTRVLLKNWKGKHKKISEDSTDCASDLIRIAREKNHVSDLILFLFDSTESAPVVPAKGHYLHSVNELALGKLSSKQARIA